MLPAVPEALLIAIEKPRDCSGFQDDGADHRTSLFSGNVIWSPTPRIDSGGELLWGQREDKDGAKSDASQLQPSAKYRF